MLFGSISNRRLSTREPRRNDSQRVTVDDTLCGLPSGLQRPQQFEWVDVAAFSRKSKILVAGQSIRTVCANCEPLKSGISSSANCAPVRNDHTQAVLHILRPVLRGLGSDLCRAAIVGVLPAWYKSSGSYSFQVQSSSACFAHCIHIRCVSCLPIKAALRSIEHVCSAVYGSPRNRPRPCIDRIPLTRGSRYVGVPKGMKSMLNRLD
jgi:hypothetical protein